MDPSSSLYAALPADLINLTSELERLGGGDARLGKLEALCFVKPSSSEERLIWPEREHVIIRDPRSPPDAPAAQALRRYRVSLALAQTDARPAIDALGRSVLDWFFAGFNAAILTYGQSGTGKSVMVFGATGADPTLDGIEECGLLVRLLTGVFSLIESSSDAKGHMVGLSAWALAGERVHDLFGRTEGSQPFNFVTAKVDDQRSALAALKHVKTAATSLRQAHVFVRVLLYRSRQRCASTLHVVDMVGCPPVEPPGGATAPRSAGDDATGRAVVSRQLSAFSRVISELSEAAAGDPSEGIDGKPPRPRRVISARDSCLTQILAPLLAGNCKTWLLSGLMDGASNFSQSVATLRTVGRAMNITSGCVKLCGISAEELGMQPVAECVPTTCLDADFPHPSATVQPGTARSKSEARSSPASRSNFERDAAESEQGMAGTANVSEGMADMANASEGMADTANVSDAAASLEAAPTPPVEAGHAFLDSDLGASVESTAASESATLSSLAAGPPWKDKDGTEGVKTCAIEYPCPVLFHSRLVLSPLEPGSARGSFVTATGTPRNADVAITPPSPHAGNIARLKHEIGLMMDSLMSDERNHGGDGLSGGPFQSFEVSVGHEHQTMRPPVAESSARSRGDDRMEPSVAGTFAGSWHEEYRSVGAVTEGSKTTTRAFNAGEEAGEALAHDTSSTDEVDLGAFMQMNHSALLGVLREEKLKENRLKTRVDELEHEMMELSTGYEAQIDGLRVAEIQMQTRVRQLSNESGFANVFSQFESQIDQLRKRCADLERRNVELETVRPAARPPTSLGSGTDSSERAQRRRLKAACNETDMLREENDALRSRERQFAVHKRVAETSAKKLGDLKSQLRERERQLLDLQLTTARLEAVVMKTQDEAKRAQQNEVVLRSERTRALEEMAVLRSHIASMESAQRRDARIGRSLATSDKSSRASQEGRASWRVTMAQIKTLLRSSQPALLPLLARLEQQLLLDESDGAATEAVLTELLVQNR